MTSEATRRSMRGNRSSGTRPELVVEAAVRRAGMRPRVQYPLPLPGVRRTADLAWPTARVALFVDGCLWHGCPIHAFEPKTNSAYWAAKVARNEARDRDTDARLAAEGWLSLRVWEHDVPRG